MPSLLPTKILPTRIVKENILSPESLLKFMGTWPFMWIKLKLTIPKDHISFPTKTHECSTSVPHLAGYSFILICSNRDWVTFIFPDVVSDESRRNKSSDVDVLCAKPHLEPLAPAVLFLCLYCCLVINETCRITRTVVQEQASCLGSGQCWRLKTWAVCTSAETHVITPVKLL